MEAERRPVPLWQFWHWPLHWQILLGLVFGAGAGYFLGVWALNRAENPTVWVAEHPIRLMAKTGGEMFLNALKLIVIPLVTSSILLAIASLAQRQGFARLGLKTLAYFLGTSTLAILLGLLLVNVFQPGRVAGDKPLLSAENVARIQANFDKESQNLAKSAQMDREKSGGTLLEKVLNVFKSLIPANPVKAAAEMDLLGLIFVSILVGFFLSRLPSPGRTTMEQFWQAVNDLSLMVTDLILRFAPIGVACLLLQTIADNYVQLAAESRFGELLSALQWFALTAVLALTLHLFIVLPAILYFFTGLGPRRHFRAFAPSLLTAFSTASSNATISVTLDCCERRAGVSRETASFVVPLGATVNMNGTALYECVAALFVVQLFGYQLDFATQFLVVLIALLTSVGVAGVPSASLVAIIIILNSVSRQLGDQVDLSAGLAILLILDRPLDMLRTAVNVFGDATGAVLIAHTEGERPLQGTPDQRA